jgi:hypothetical protein
MTTGDPWWRTDTDLCSKLIRKKQEIASAEFDNALQRWVGFDYTRPDDSPVGCLKLGPFVTLAEAMDALEKSVL